MKESYEDIISQENPLYLDRCRDNTQYVKKTKQAREITKKQIKGLIKYWYVPVLLLILLLFGKKLLFFSVILIMLAVVILVDLHRLVIPTHIGIEVVAFCAIILSVTISPMVGAIFAVVATVSSHVIAHHVSVFVVVKSIVYVGMCFLAPLLIPIGVVKTGIILIVLANAIFVGSNLLFMGSTKILKYLAIATVHISLNAWLFSILGTKLVGLF